MIAGEYRVNLPDGRVQIVSYEASAERGKAMKSSGLSNWSRYNLKFELFIGKNQPSFVALNLKLQNWYCRNLNSLGQFIKNLDRFEEFTRFHDFAKKVMWLMYVTKAKPFTLIPHQNQKPIKGAKKCTKEKWKTHTWNSR